MNEPEGYQPPASALNKTELEEYFRNLTANNDTKDLPENFTESFLKFQEMQAFAFLRLKFINQFNQLPKNIRLMLGHQMEDSIVDCTFDGSECKDARDFATGVNPLFGTCFTFNSNSTSSGRRKSMHLPGAEHGLTLEMLLDQQDYLKSITHSAGLRLLVHDQDTYPFPEDEGINIHPGMETSIGLRKIPVLKFQSVVKRLSSPYPSKCVESTNVNMISRLDGFWYGGSGKLKYSSQGCSKTCLQRTIIQHCSCARPGWPYKGPAFDDLHNWTGNETLCSSSWRHMFCERASEHFYNGQTKCLCPPSCRDTSFFPVISQSMWPSETYLVPMLFGDLGGQVGLWLGLSVLTLFEVAELLFDILCLGIHKDNLKKKNSVHDKLTKVAVVERL